MVSALPPLGVWGPLLHPQTLAVLSDPYFSPEALDLFVLPGAPTPRASFLTSGLLQ